jgi:multidrug efflux pump
VNVCAPFIRRPVGTSLLAIGLFLSGIIAYRFIQWRRFRAWTSR